MDFYLVRLPNQKPLLYGEGEHFHPGEPASFRQEDSHWLDRFLERLRSKPGRGAHLLLKLITATREAYFKLENTIDPLERVVKRVRHAHRLEVYLSTDHSPSKGSQELATFLSRQKFKHTLWLGIDSIVTVIAIAFTPFLVPIPGPNLFFYYPLLRTYSHFRALKAARHGLQLKEKHFHGIQPLAGIEEILRQPSSIRDEEQLEILCRNLKQEGMPAFLRRYLPGRKKR